MEDAEDSKCRLLRKSQVINVNSNFPSDCVSVAQTSMTGTQGQPKRMSDLPGPSNEAAEAYTCDDPAPPASEAAGTAVTGNSFSPGVKGAADDAVVMAGPGDITCPGHHTSSRRAGGVASSPAPSIRLDAPLTVGACGRCGRPADVFILDDEFCRDCANALKLPALTEFPILMSQL